MATAESSIQTLCIDSRIERAAEHLKEHDDVTKVSTTKTEDSGISGIIVYGREDEMIHSTALTIPRKHGFEIAYVSTKGKKPRVKFADKKNYRFDY